jgi:hypothetical protein
VQRRDVATRLNAADLACPEPAYFSLCHVDSGIMLQSAIPAASSSVFGVFSGRKLFPEFPIFRAGQGIRRTWSCVEFRACSAQAHSHAQISANALSARRRIGAANDQGFRGFGGRSSIRWAFRCGEADGRVSRAGGGSDRASKRVRKVVLGKE